MLGWFKATRHTALTSVIRVREKVINDIFEMLVYFSRRIVYSANIGGIIDDSFLKSNRAIFIYLRNEEGTHEF